jgi:DNA-directed RNA polymerase delta subunit
MEMEILNNYLGFVVPRVTLIEVAKLVLFAADPEFDYSAIMVKVVALLNFCMIDNEI